MSTASIQLRNAGLVLPIYGTINRSLKGAVMASATGGRMAAASRHVTIIEALRSIDLDIRSGDRVGLMGHNGAGKTSLLRMMAGIYEPTSGSCVVQGRVSSFINLGMGMDFEATGRENLQLCGLMFGMRAEDIRRIAPEIVEFSGLGDFVDMPVRTYSSGMLARLVFSIVTSVPAEIVLMDEWLSVGDAEFAVQAQARLHKLVEAASILVLASHSEAVIQDMCNVIVRMEHGEVKSIERKGA